MPRACVLTCVPVCAVVHIRMRTHKQQTLLCSRWCVHAESVKPTKNSSHPKEMAVLFVGRVDDAPVVAIPPLGHEKGCPSRALFAKLLVAPACEVAIVPGRWPVVMHKCAVEEEGAVRTVTSVVAVKKPDGGGQTKHAYYQIQADENYG